MFYSNLQNSVFVPFSTKNQMGTGYRHIGKKPSLSSVRFKYDICRMYDSSYTILTITFVMIMTAYSNAMFTMGVPD